MDFHAHCTEIVAQTGLLVADLDGADLRAPVPSCPGWTLGGLLRHIGGGQRWAEEMVRTRATEYLPDAHFRDVKGDDSGPAPVAWLAEGADRLAATLRAAGPDAVLWAPFDYGTTTFWARRFANETLVHRADATLAAGTEFAVEKDVAMDAVDEWMELDALPQHFDIEPAKREILGEGRTLAFEATDAGVNWLVDLTGDVVAWRRGPGTAAVTVRGPLADLLLVIYRRATADGVEVLGDRPLLDLWSGHIAFG